MKRISAHGEKKLKLRRASIAKPAVQGVIEASSRPNGATLVNNSQDDEEYKASHVGNV